MAYYGYIRVSTKGQVPGTSLAEQEQQIKERYPTATIVKEAASGAHERQVFDNLCKSLQAGDTLVVCKMDRFCRSAKGFTFKEHHEADYMDYQLLSIWRNTDSAGCAGTAGVSARTG